MYSETTKKIARKILRLDMSGCIISILYVYVIVMLVPTSLSEKFSRNGKLDKIMILKCKHAKTFRVVKSYSD